MPRLMLMAAIWSFVVAPALCRAGALTACCTHEDAPPAPATCCQEHEPASSGESPDSGAPQRECGSCADVCKGVAKPDESRHLPTLDTHVQPWDTVAAHYGATATGVAAGAAFDGLIDTPRLPFPASGLPLRI